MFSNNSPSNVEWPTLLIIYLPLYFWVSNRLNVKVVFVDASSTVKYSLVGKQNIRKKVDFLACAVVHTFKIKFHAQNHFHLEQLNVVPMKVMLFFFKYSLHWYFTYSNFLSHACLTNTGIFCFLLLSTKQLIDFRHFWPSLILHLFYNSRFLFQGSAQVVD